MFLKLFLLVALVFSFGCKSTSTKVNLNADTSIAVKICNQVWMSKNLSINHYNNGDIIPQIKNPAQWANLTTGAWCWYNNDSEKYAIYGKLYNFYAVNDERGLAPNGWHIATDAEWNTLIKCIDNNADTFYQGYQITRAGGKLKERGLSHWTNPNTGADDDYGFTALPGGNRDEYGAFTYIESIGHWWSSSKFDSLTAWYRYLHYSSNDIVRFGCGNKKYGFSVRCIKD